MGVDARVAVVGSGSWATAIVKILHENVDLVQWYVRNDEMFDYIQQHGHNPRYLSAARFDMARIRLQRNLNTLVSESDVVFFVVPSAFLPAWLEPLTADLSRCFAVTAIKGIIPDIHMTASEYLKSHFGLSYSRIGVVSGPCHAEEVAQERLSYLTFSCKSLDDSERIATLFRSFYIRTILGQDIYGTEYSAILKNIYAVAVGVANGLGYGDNFQAVLTCNAQAELARFLNHSYPGERCAEASAYLGDLLVTCYSQYSRNRTFGTMIGKGYSVLSAQMEMAMIAEGYYATGGIHAVNAKHGVEMPIAEAMYNILYEGHSPAREMEILTHRLV